MSISPHTLSIQPDRVFIGAEPRAGPRGRGLSRSLAPETAAANSLREEDFAPASASISMPTEDQMAKLRYAALAEAVRRLIGGEHSPSGETS